MKTGCLENIIREVMKDEYAVVNLRVGGALLGDLHKADDAPLLSKSRAALANNVEVMTE